MTHQVQFEKVSTGMGSAFSYDPESIIWTGSCGGRLGALMFSTANRVQVLLDDMVRLSERLVNDGVQW